MKLKLAKETLSSKPKELDIKEIIEILEEKKVVFLDNSNKEDDIKKLLDKLKDYKVYLNTVGFGLAEDEFIYEVHIL